MNLRRTASSSYDLSNVTSQGSPVNPGQYDPLDSILGVPLLESVIRYIVWVRWTGDRLGAT
jgi:hypothetical protein